MSDFTYACPVCRQHLKCDSSQGGTIMKCPTCYQRIVAPQAPSNSDSKLILTGQKYIEKPLPTPAGGAAKSSAPEKPGAPIGMIAAIVGVLVALGGAFLVYHYMFAVKWQAMDVGPVDVPGSFQESKGVFTIKGSGADIWFQSDSFQYVYSEATGDCTLTARVLNLKNTDEWAKATVMIRESRQPNSMFAAASVRPDGQVQFLYRKATGVNAETTFLVGGQSFPKWIRITRTGNTFSSYYKLKAEEDWKQIWDSQVINMAPQAMIGMAVCAHKNGTMGEAQFDQVTLNAVAKAKASPAASVAGNGMLLPHARQGAYNWRYTTTAPAADWAQPAFNANSWSQGPGSFGSLGTPNAIVKTEWTSSDIWLRREFTLTKVPAKPLLLEIFHDDAAEVYINGVLAARLSGFTENYVKTDISAQALAALRPGRNYIAVHCHQDNGGQNIDVGLTE